MSAEEPKQEGTSQETVQVEPVIRNAVELQNKQLEEEVNETVLQALTGELEEEIEEKLEQQSVEEQQNAVEEGSLVTANVDTPEKKEEKSYCLCNVVEVLIEDYYLEFMKEENMCMCDKCQWDVKAVALSHILPQYCVVNRGENPPLINYFRKKLVNTIIVETINAWKIVKNMPNHKE